jgi:hypothetical protein
MRKALMMMGAVPVGMPLSSEAVVCFLDVSS